MFIHPETFFNLIEMSWLLLREVNTQKQSCLFHVHPCLFQVHWSGSSKCSSISGSGYRYEHPNLHPFMNQVSNSGDLGTFQMFISIPRKMNGWNLQPSPVLKGKWSEPNLHEDMFQPLILGGVPLKETSSSRVQNPDLRFLALRSQFASLTESIVGSLGCRATKSFRVSVSFRWLVDGFGGFSAVLTKVREMFQKVLGPKKGRLCFLGACFKDLFIRNGNPVFFSVIENDIKWPIFEGTCIPCLAVFWVFGDFFNSGQLN